MYPWNRWSVVVLSFAAWSAVSVSGAKAIGSYNVYYGDLHNHCSVDDYGHAIGTPAAAYAYAKNTAHLDFLGLTPHDVYITSSEWSQMGIAADAATVDGAFVAFRGFEWTTGYLGHFTILNSGDRCTSSQTATNTVAKIITWIGARTASGCVAFFNHPGRQDGSGIEFDHFIGSPANNIIGMELWNNVNPFSVYYYNKGYYPDDNNKGYFDEALAHGWKIGAAGAGDNHTGTWGTLRDFRCGILAPALTRADLLAALQSRRFFSTLDKNIALSFTIGGNEMGSTILGKTSQVLRVLATDADGELFAHITVFNANHDVIAAWNPNTASVDVSLDIDTYDGQYFYVIVKETDGDEAISSPIWISGNLAATPPTCNLTAPDGSETYTAPAQIYCAATASDDGSIVKVLFHADGRLIGEDASSNYEVYWKNVPEGTYSITATALDNTGATTTSAGQTIVVAPAPGTYHIDVRIASSSDDAEENVSSGAVTLTSTDLDLTYNKQSSSTQLVGLRFTDCALPHNVTITSAYLQFTCDETSSAATTLVISGEADDDAATFSSSIANLSGRSITASTVAWTVPAWTTVGAATETERTPDLSRIVQEMVTRNEYTPASPLAFLIRGSGTRIAQSFNGNPTNAPLLHVDYTTLPPPNTLPVCAITAPLSGTTFTTGSEVTMNVAATDFGGHVTLVNFYIDGTLIGQDESEPYAWTIAAMEPGMYTLTAIATDDSGATSMANTVTIVVRKPNNAPTCLITTPVDGASLDSVITISIDATDTDGSVVNVDFYVNGTKISHDAEFPYSLTWSSPVSGTYAVYAIATDNDGTSTTSETVTVTTTVPNHDPVADMVITPMNGVAPVTITADASASSDPDGDALTYTWNFGDGSANTAGKTVSHTYTRAGSYTVFLSVDDKHGGTSSTTAVVTVTTAPAGVYQINCGGKAASPFGADQFYSGGSTKKVNTTIVTTGVTNPAPQNVYLNYRYGSFSYTIMNLEAATTYTVRLHFAETYLNAKGKRSFNVAINGSIVLSDFDIYAEAGGKSKAVIREFTATADANKKIIITFMKVLYNATVAGIEIIR